MGGRRVPTDRPRCRKFKMSGSSNHPVVHVVRIEPSCVDFKCMRPAATTVELSNEERKVTGYEPDPKIHRGRRVCKLSEVWVRAIVRRRRAATQTDISRTRRAAQSTRITERDPDYLWTLWGGDRDSRCIGFKVRNGRRGMSSRSRAWGGQGPRAGVLRHAKTRPTGLRPEVTSLPPGEMLGGAPRSVCAGPRG
jgi:hypothetical protein